MAPDEFAQRLDAKPLSGGWIARCPAHADNDASLKIDEGDDGRVLLYCFAGCSTASILKAMRLTWDDLFPDTAAPPDPWIRVARAIRRDHERWWATSGYLEEGD